MDSYLIIKGIHITCAAASGALFVVRGIWHLQDSDRLQRPWVRIVPHAVDALLLVSAVFLMLLSGQYPGLTGWLSVKLIAVFLYIGLGLLAFRFARRASVRLGAWLGALIVFAYIVYVALTRQLAPFG